MATQLQVDDLPRTDEMRRRQAVEQGLPVKMLRALMSDGTVGLHHLTRVIAPRRTLERRLRDGERLTVEESDRLARLVRVLDLASHTFGDRQKAVDWLSAPKRAFGGAAPLDLIRTSVGSDEVENFFHRAAHGMLA
ncbi:MAG: hypothetical protein AVDCRST_MAG09-437 [uncultured Sphingomonas sp.]|uniref:Uncharacterized protein n=1 Tax=uncultured Sphingomonas sp. TaxID=158754 RepID=A0A6J4SE66_9SPHN|nr:antitoxin Xre/MbcA/ParS toxin-binding domain-containing protein [uncultured Sphingomonas sp.]CAA9496498.1 MAG: hypothetical protein AVDCRST_MAG09-437 [uncultured Sphingomonas sp.]